MEGLWGSRARIYALAFLLAQIAPSYAGFGLFCRRALTTHLIEQEKNSPVKHATTVDPKHVENIGLDVRRDAKNQVVDMHDGTQVVGLKPRKGADPRRPEQISAQFENLGNQFAQMRHELAAADGEPRSAEMTVEGFLGRIDGAFGKGDQSIGAIMQQFGINHVRFVRGKKFKSKVVTVKDPETKLKSSEVVLEIPDVDFSDHVAAALWMKNFVLALHRAAYAHVAARLDGAKFDGRYFPNGRFSWLDNPAVPTRPGTDRYLWIVDSGNGKSFRDMTYKLDRASQQMIRELDAYVKAEAPGLTPQQLDAIGISDPHNYDPDELLDLREKNYRIDRAYPYVVYPIETTTLPAGAWVELARSFLKVGHPLSKYEPTRLWIDTPDGLKIERANLEKRLRIYFDRRKRASAVRWWTVGTVVMKYSVHGLIWWLHGGMVANAQTKIDQQKKETPVLNTMIETAEQAAGKDKILAAKAKLLAELAIYEKTDNETAVVQIHKALLILDDNLEALAADGIEATKPAPAPNSQPPNSVDNEGNSNDFDD